MMADPVFRERLEAVRKKKDDMFREELEKVAEATYLGGTTDQHMDNRHEISKRVSLGFPITKRLEFFRKNSAVGTPIGRRRETHVRGNQIWW